MTSSFSDKHHRLYRWFFEEYNKQYINYEKYYEASEHYRWRAKQVRWGTGILSSLIIIIVLTIVQGFYQNILTPVVVGLSLLTGVISLIGSIGDFERKYIIYYNSGQEHDDLYSEFDNMIKVRLPDPSADFDELKEECDRLVEEKDELNGLTPQLEERWYNKMVEERGEDAVHWDPQPLEKMREAKFKPDSEETESNSKETETTSE
ncbi:hypothetical protein [Halorubrum cibi]|uniref:SMODS and SLOG-associating 2TM effector domain-containing protein n=1 Tax=Halorubrum cibi TaxID=413815 RepID=A0A521EDP4_9EURY|nr:hypothetical protein [Halorubrum cibi]SMO81571.1 hypothetical protein SAMN06264867_11032 [Halorubrum cibi]